MRAWTDHMLTVTAISIAALFVWNEYCSIRQLMMQDHFTMPWEMQQGWTVIYHQRPWHACALLQTTWSKMHAMLTWQLRCNHHCHASMCIQAYAQCVCRLHNQKMSRSLTWFPNLSKQDASHQWPSCMLILECWASFKAPMMHRQGVGMATLACHIAVHVLYLALTLLVPAWCLRQNLTRVQVHDNATSCFCNVSVILQCIFEIKQQMQRLSSIYYSVILILTSFF